MTWELFFLLYSIGVTGLALFLLWRLMQDEHHIERQQQYIRTLERSRHGRSGN